MRIIYSFLIVLASVFLLLIPYTELIYTFRTDQASDSFNITTGVGVTTANVTLAQAIYDNDTSTVGYTSNISESLAVSSYNSTTRQLTTSGLTANTIRTVAITYDVNAIPDSDAVNTLLDRFAWIYLLVAIAFPAAGLAAIWTDHV